MFRLGKINGHLVSDSYVYMTNTILSKQNYNKQEGSVIGVGT